MIQLDSQEEEKQHGSRSQLDKEKELPDLLLHIDSVQGRGCSWRSPVSFGSCLQSRASARIDEQDSSGLWDIHIHTE